MSYPPFQYKMLPTRYSRPGSGFDSRPQANESRLMGPLKPAQLPGREYPFEMCDSNPNEIQKYFWDDPYDLPIYDPSDVAREFGYRDTMTLGQFTPRTKPREFPWTLYRRKTPDEMQPMEADGSVSDLKEHFKLKEHFGLKEHFEPGNGKILLLIIGVVAVLLYLMKGKKN